MKIIRNPRVLLRVTSLLLALLLLAACSSEATESTTPDAGQHLTVLAASSLTESFTQIADAFESEHEGLTVDLSFGPSDGLAQQIDSGSPVNVFASASTEWMDDVEQNGPGVSGRTDFARNKLVVIVPKDNPAKITTFADLATSGIKLVMAAEGVPVGDYAREALGNAGISKEADANIASNEEDAKAVVQKVLLGEADAGIVYVTDVTEEVSGEISPVEIPDDVNVIATYPIAVIAESPDAQLSQAFVDLVVGSEGQETLQSFGFMPAA